MANDFGTTKSVFILTIVAGCFAILWPNVFYPMVSGDYYKAQVEAEASGSGCCDVIFDNDINGIKIMTELCEKILNRNDLENDTLASFTQGKLNKDTIELCKKTVYDKCNLNISELLSKNVALGKDYKQTIDLLRTLNSSICLRESFGVSLGQMGLPRRMRVWGLNISKHMKPERPPHLHPDMLHPALREKGRAIQQSKKAAELRAGSPNVAGMRPTLGGAGHVVAPPKGGTTMGIVMPMYTIGIVIFFLYTMLRLLFKKGGDGQACEEFTSDADFHRDVFGLNQDFVRDKSPDSTKLGDMELEMLKERLQETEKAMERIVAKMMSLPKRSSSKDAGEEFKEEGEKGSEGCESSTKDVFMNAEPQFDSETLKGEESVEGSTTEEDDLQSKAGVKVIGMETTETCEGGKWSRPETPRPPTPQNIYLPAVLPDQSKIIVTNSSTETITSSEDNAPVVLSGKVTLSLIGIQDAGISDDVHSYHEATIKMSTESLSATDPLTLTGKSADQLKLDENEDKTLVTNG